MSFRNNQERIEFIKHKLEVNRIRSRIYYRKKKGIDVDRHPKTLTQIYRTDEECLNAYDRYLTHNKRKKFRKPKVKVLKPKPLDKNVNITKRVIELSFD